MNLALDEEEQNRKIRDLVDIAVRLFGGSPDGGEPAEDNGSDNRRAPTKETPDVYYETNEANIRKVLSTEFDKIIESGGKYKGFNAEVIKEK